MQKPWIVGVDVAKESVVASGSELPARQIPNREAALKVWLRSLPPGSRIGMEATGRYHGLLADLAHECGLTVYVLNPKDIWYYGKGLGRRGKTDRLDAEVIAAYLTEHHAHLRVYTPAIPQQRDVDRLLKRRAHLVEQQKAARALLEDLDECPSQSKGLLKSFDVLIEAIEAKLAELTRQHAPLQETQKRLRTIVGIGPLTGLTLASAFTRIPFRDANAVIAYTGLDPRPHDSGRMSGRRRLSKRGPGELRRLLYAAAMSAAQSPVWKPTYQRYRARGLTSTETYVILARKLARVAWSLHKHQTEFDPQMAA
jgi:transposase